MKSIIESVAEWLRANPYLSVEPTTDALRCGVEAAGLFKAPESVREYYVDGTFSMPSETDTDQIWEMSLAVSYDDKLTEE